MNRGIIAAAASVAALLVVMTTPTPAPAATCTFGSGTQVVLTNGAITVTLNLTGHQEMDFSPSDPTGARDISIPSAGTHVDCVTLPLSSGIACVRADPAQNGSGAIDCNGSAGMSGYNVATSQDHNTNDIDPSCSASSALLEDGSAAHPHTGVCNGPVQSSGSGTFPAGGMQLSEHLIIRNIASQTSCSPDACPADGTPLDTSAGDLPFNLLVGTGSASGTITDQNNTPGATVSGNITGATQDCSAIDAGNLSIGAPVGALPALDLNTLGDSVVTFKIKCQ